MTATPSSPRGAPLPGEGLASLRAMTNPTPPTASPGVDYAHLPGEEQNPLMESTAHVDWGLVLLNAARHVLADTDNLVTGNVAFAPDDGGPLPRPTSW